MRPELTLPPQVKFALESSQSATDAIFLNASDAAGGIQYELNGTNSGQLSSTATSFGFSSSAAGVNSVAIGNTAIAANVGDVSIGEIANTTGAGVGKVAIGSQVVAVGDHNVVIGFEAETTDDESVAIRREFRM